MPNLSTKTRHFGDSFFLATPSTEARTVLIGVINILELSLQTASQDYTFRLIELFEFVKSFSRLPAKRPIDNRWSGRKDSDLDWCASKESG